MLKEITILIPTYNRSELLNKNLESISSQDYKGKINCIISDNYSVDDTESVVNIWRNRNKNIFVSYLKNKSEIPPIENFMNTTQKIDTEYSKFLQDDDWLEPNAISRIEHYLDLYNADSLVFNCNIFSYTQKEPRYRYYNLETGPVDSNSVVNSFLRINSAIPTSPSISIHKSEMVREALLFGMGNIECTQLLLGNDLIFTYLGVFDKKNVYFIDESIVNFWGGQDSITMYADRHLFSSCYFKSLIMLIEKFNYSPNNEQLKRIQHRIFIHNLKQTYKSELKNVKYEFNYNPKLSLSESLKYIKSKLI